MPRPPLCNMSTGGEEDRASPAGTGLPTGSFAYTNKTLCKLPYASVKTSHALRGYVWVAVETAGVAVGSVLAAHCWSIHRDRL